MKFSQLSSIFGAGQENRTPYYWVEASRVTNDTCHALAVSAVFRQLALQVFHLVSYDMTVLQDEMLPATGSVGCV